MTIGDKIKIIRCFRGMTQKELGLALNFQDNQAAQRIYDYERNNKTPKDDVVARLIKIFQISPYALLKKIDIPCIEMIECIFWFEETMQHNLVNNRFLRTDIDIEMQNKGSDPENKTEYQASKYSLTGVPENDFIFTSMQMKNYLQHKIEERELSREAYLYWKLCWPYNIQLHDFFRLYNNKSFSNEPVGCDRGFCQNITDSEEFAKKEFKLIKLDYDIPFLSIAEDRIAELKQYYKDVADFEESAKCFPDTRTIDPLYKLEQLRKHNAYVVPPRKY